MKMTIDEFWSQMLALPFAPAGGTEMLFRGVTDAQYELVPSIGRGTSDYIQGGIDGLEEPMMTEFKRLVAPVVAAPPTTDSEWMFLAQHYGLPTRLLDWTTNPLVALFFATERNDRADGAVYYLRHMVSDQYNLFDLSTANYKPNYRIPISVQPELGNVLFLRPKYTDARYLNQRSVFSCPRDPFVKLQVDGIAKLTVPANLKWEIRKRLRVLGVSSSYIYPGLDGVASEIKSLFFDPVVAGRRRYLSASMEIDVGACRSSLS